MTEKKIPPVVTPVSDPKLKKALEEASDIFSSRSEDYNEVSNDIKGTEEFLRSKGIKDVFTFDFDRRNLQVMPIEYTSDGPFEYYREGLDWRFDHKSKKFRLMVTDYLCWCEPLPDIDPRDPNPPITEFAWYILETRPLMEHPIQTRVFYHPKLEQFIHYFSATLKNHKAEGKIYNGQICVPTLSIDGLKGERFYDHVKDDHIIASKDNFLVEEGMVIQKINPGGTSTTPPGTTRKVPATEAEIKRFEKRIKDLKDEAEAKEDWDNYGI